MENNQLTDKLKQLNSGIDFKRILGSVLSKWYWFVLCVATTFTIGYLYIRYTTPEYSIKSQVLIEEVNKSPGSNLLNQMNSGGGQQAAGGLNQNLFNEMFVLRSQDLIGMVVDSLNLNVRFWTQGRIKQDEIFQTCPIDIVFDSNGYVGGYTQEIRLKQIVDGLFEFKEEKITDRVLYDAWIPRPYGRFKIVYRNGGDVNKEYLKKNTEIIVRIEQAKNTIGRTLGAFQVLVSDGRTSLLDLIYTDNLPGRGVDLMNVLIHFYRKKELEDLNLSAQKTREFIAQLKTDLIKDLKFRDSVEEGIKLQNKLIDVSTQASSFLAEKTTQQQRIQALLIQKQEVQSLKRNVVDGAGSRFQVIAGVGADDPFIVKLVGDYNTAISQMEVTERNTGKLHPSVLKIKADIAAMRKQIADACDRVTTSLDISLQNASRNLSESDQMIQAIPTAERNISDVKREYNVMQSIYLYLYQRGVENDIQQYSAGNKSKVVVAPYASGEPIKPVNKTIYAMCILLGLLLPGSIIVTRVMLNNKVINENDIENLTSIPIIGTITRAPEGVKNKNIVVGPHIRTTIAEQFRLIRANLEFMSANGNKKVFLVTSSMSGEGKTFVSLNLGITMTLAKKRVVIMEFDLRKPKLSSYLGLQNDGGISAYLAGMSGIERVIKASGVHENLYIANCGPVPPNPGELLVLPSAQQLIDELQEMFDIIIIDTAPIGLVSDALILSQYSDTNMFIIRQSYTVKDQIRLFDTLYKEKKIRNAAIIFNGVEFLKKYGYGYGGAYGYGYQYGGSGGSYYMDDGKPARKKLMDVLFKK
jgi:tyrosine-protein kinase Etk/Wzc